MSAAAALRTPEALARAGLIGADRVAALEQVAARYALAVTPAMEALIDAADPADPIARQFLPDEAELAVHPLERADPIGDAAHSPVKGIVHRYPDRVLITPTHACAVYCRFCFRREVVGPAGAGTLSAGELDAAFAYIAAHPEIWEVIVTGGDPLVLSPRRLRDLGRRLQAIDHVKVVRFHTRVPAVDPQAVTDELISALKVSGKASYVALHANHPRELGDAARAACARIVDAGVPMLGQTVLLRGVNDEPGVLAALFRAMVETRIKPYYLHLADRAPGTAHLRTSLGEGQALMRELRGRVSGLCQPSLVLDIPGGYGKIPVGPCYLTTEHQDEATVRLVDPWGHEHLYPNEHSAERLSGAAGS